MKSRFFLPPSVFVLIVVWGCASPPPTPHREGVILETSSSTQYYAIRGMTRDAIFDDIEKNGLFDMNAGRAVGLTAAEWSIDWKAVERHPALCSLSMTITLNLVVTLPRHDQLSDLSQDVTTKWQRFAARVAGHEQRHVDIYLDGAKRMKTRMEAILTKTSSCSELETMIRSISASQKADTEKAQNEFHAEDEAKIQGDQKSLQVQIDINQTRLTSINSEIRDLDQTLDGFERHRDRARAEIAAVEARMAKSGASQPSCSQSRLTSGIQALCQRYNGRATAYRALVDQHSKTVSRRNNLADEHNHLVAATNSLIEILAWTR